LSVEGRDGPEITSCWACLAVIDQENQPSEKLPTGEESGNLHPSEPLFVSEAPNIETSSELFEQEPKQQSRQLSGQLAAAEMKTAC
jgi:hypothetical protein